MPVGEIRGVIGRLQLLIPGMAVAAAEGRIYLAVTHQAVGHAREVLVRPQICFSDSAVAGQARVFRVQMPAHIARRREIAAALDRTRQHLAHVPEAQVESVIETKSSPRSGAGAGIRRISMTKGAFIPSSHAVVTCETCLLAGKIVILCGGAGRYGGVALDTVGSLPRQVLSMRKDQLSVPGSLRETNAEAEK